VVLVTGEVHTGLVQHSTSIPTSVARKVLALRLGEVVRTFERPVSYAVSPEVYTGVDCKLATLGSARPRVVGTTVSRAAITGGQILQASTRVEMARGGSDRRLPWAHYLAQPGRAETIGKVRWDAVATGFLATAGTGLDLGGIAGRLMGDVQGRAELDRRAPFRIARTRVRWLLEPSETGAERVVFTVQDGALRTLRLTSASLTAAQAAEFVEDVARHDWLLTALLSQLDKSRLYEGVEGAVMERLRPAVEHLLPLWMPAARLDEGLRAFWQSLERVSGFSRQWEMQVGRVRDHLALRTITLLRSASAEETPEPV
jgi:hypothetical protein